MLRAAAVEVKSARGGSVAAAWGVTLLVSLLPDIYFREAMGWQPAWLFGAKVGLLAALLVVSQMWGPLRELRLFFAVLLAVFGVGWGVERLFQGFNLETRLTGAGPFVGEMLAVQIPRVLMGVMIVLVALGLVRRRERVFLVKGNLEAQAAPVPVIMSRPTTWRIMGPAAAGSMCLGLLVFILAFGSAPSLQDLQGVLPLLPFVVLFAASNAFGEEMIYRAPWLGALEGVVGPAHALLITAVHFGILHYYGVPYGVLGVVMAFIPGWLMGKAMLETRGFFWAWFIHLCMDTVIFFFMALGSVRPGG